MAEYETMSRQELMKLRADIDRAIASVGDREKRAALKAAEAAAREHGFSLTELAAEMGGARGRAPGRAKSEGAAPARFRNPDDPTQTWSGRGRRPRWFNEHEAAGRLDAMRVG
jgi:DNA-binding protein H-NS